MTRGHRGSLDLRCRALSSPSPCRFIPTLSTRPVFPSPAAARMERAAASAFPRASHPADQEPTTHVEVGTGQRARTWNYSLNITSVDPPIGSSLTTCDLASHDETEQRGTRGPGTTGSSFARMRASPPVRQRKRARDELRARVGARSAHPSLLYRCAGAAAAPPIAGEVRMVAPDVIRAVGEQAFETLRELRAAARRHP